ncbi:MAG: molybdenum cofactor biosynthesis protein MoaE [Alicyclobacillus sp.]|nr:molybdenum cofactor biosynthesis protein MoaE [Alicyclobacillus sp.]
MEVTVRLFAGLAETLGARQLTLEVAPNTRAGELKAALVARYPYAAEQIARALVAVDRAYAPDDHVVLEGAEIAFIPPVGGGSEDSGEPCAEGEGPLPPALRLTPHPLDPAQARRLLTDPRHGGVVVFCGTVREWTRDRRTLWLEYEAYAEMALAKMQEIADSVTREWPDVSTVMWHRIGRLFPGETAVVCAASAPHRADAFAAARALIDRLKREVPIWKKEHYADGEDVWQANEEP